MQNLYRHYDKTNQLLYVGISISALTRLASHKGNSHWFESISRVDIEQCTDRKNAVIKEKEAIQCEWPLYNIIHNLVDLRKIDVKAECEKHNITPKFLMEWLYMSYRTD